MKFGVHVLLPAETPLDEWKRFVHLAEDAGLAQLAVGDIQTRCLECYVHLTMIALNTSRVRLGPLISNPTTRHPGVVASGFASLQRLSNGRAFLGISTGNSALRNLGLPAARLEDMREHIRVFRELVKSGASQHQGRKCVLPWVPQVVPQGVPVYIAANGPKSMRLAGEIADGVIMGGGVTQDVVEQALTYVEDGARSAGRTLDDIDIWFQSDMNIAETDQKAVDQMKNILVGIASRNFRFTFEGKGVPKSLERSIRAMEKEYQYAEHVTDTAGNERLLDKYGLTEFFADRWLVAGTVDTVVKKLKRLESYGIKQVHIPALVPDPFKLLTQLRDQVMPRLASPKPAR
ncbi:MAG: LLM class flavin-dependent oxidoreductase [Chloroflexi bacterium]|nr:LLM class flavin-dependent oxidoreductase [Chloroflexota bacterium]